MTNMDNMGNFKGSLKDLAFAKQVTTDKINQVPNLVTKQPDRIVELKNKENTEKEIKNQLSKLKDELLLVQGTIAEIIKREVLAKGKKDPVDMEMKMLLNERKVVITEEIDNLNTQLIYGNNQERAVA